MSTGPKYQIGQKVFWGTFESSENSVECPHCGGTARVLVTFHDETTVSIECGNCSGSILQPATGRVVVHDRQPETQLVIVTGYEVSPDRGTRYRGHLNYIIEESALFLTKSEAIEYAKEIAVKMDREERERVQQKEKPTRTWAWHATYHRRCIKNAKREIEYHEARLAVASLKAKKD